MAIATGAIIGLASAGMGLQMKGQYEAGRAAERQAKRENLWQQYKAQLEERKAEERQEAAAKEEEKLRKAGERGKRRRITQVGQAGILPTGSFELTQKSFAEEIEKDALEIRRGGTIGYQQSMASATISRGMGATALLRGRSRRRGSYYRMAGTGLMGAAQLAYMSSGSRPMRNQGFRRYYA